MIIANKIKELEKELTGSKKLQLLKEWRPIDLIIDLKSVNGERAVAINFISRLFLFAFFLFFYLYLFFCNVNLYRVKSLILTNKKVDSTLCSYCKARRNSAPLILFQLKNQAIMEQTQTIPLRIYKHATLHSTEFHSWDNQ